MIHETPFWSLCESSANDEVKDFPGVNKYINHKVPMFIISSPKLVRKTNLKDSFSLAGAKNISKVILIQKFLAVLKITSPIFQSC